MRRAQVGMMAVVLLCVGAAHAQKPEVERPTGGVVDFLAPVEADPIVQHSKEVYVRNGCAYCHGIDLKVRNGEAADLMHSSIVAGDVNGNIIGPLLRNGIPQTAKLSPMPQFSDLSERNVQDLARWIHYARQQGQFIALTTGSQPTGVAKAGGAYFAKNCSSCHSNAAIAAVVKRSGAELRTRVLRPAALGGMQSFKLSELHDEKKQVARQRHGAWLETVSAQDMADLTEWLQTLR